MPSLNGLINGFSWSGLSLHYKDMGWPIARSGVGCAIGFAFRAVFQQVQLRAGFWVMVPLGIIHLTAAILGIFYTTEEWAVIVEIACLQCLDSAITIEGLAFDVFGLSENLARQASSTLLACFTISVASAVTIGGVIYDLAGWQGMSTFHAICQACLLLLFVTQPMCLLSFKEFFFPQPEELEDEEDEEITTAGFTGVLPVESTPTKKEAGPAALAAAAELPGQPEPVVEDLEVEELQDIPLPPPVPPIVETPGAEAIVVPWRPQAEPLVARWCPDVGPWPPLLAFSALSSFSDNFQHHFGASNVLRPSVAQRTGGADPVRRQSVLTALTERTEGTQESEGRSIVGKTKSTKGGLPKDLRLPAALLVLCCFNNTFSYNTEFATFAIFFKEHHGWNSATFASIAQTSGDLIAAVMMKILGGSVDDGVDRTFWRNLISQPYNLSWLLAFWILFNMGMISPFLPLAVTAQVFMGTVYVYTSKFTTDLNLFYSLGDSAVFLSLQVYGKNADALGGCISSFLATWLYDEVSPFAPFFLSTVVSFLILIFYTMGFCRRVGFGDDIETAEAKRGRRLGLRRDSKWSVVSRKSTCTNRSEERIQEVTVVSNSLQQIPQGALLVELTPDGKERTMVWSWMEFFGCIGILLGQGLPTLGETNCASSPETGCYEYFFIALILGFVFLLSNLNLVWQVKERPAKTLTDEAEGFVPSIVGCVSNFPFSILLLSDVVEGFGGNLPLLILPYVLDWIVGKEAAEELVGSVGRLYVIGAMTHMAIRVPMNFAWRWAAGRFGKYYTYMAYEFFYGCHMFLFLIPDKGTTGAILGIILCGTWGIAYAGHWLLYDLVSDVADYDELLTGQRREGQLTMARELVPKICEIPADALPFLLMGYYGYNPDLAEQNESVKWVIRGSISVLPGAAGLLGTMALLFFTLRKKDQHEKIIRGIQQHQAGCVATDPLTGLRLPPIKREGGTVEFEGQKIGR
ncbi:Putative sulfoquinovose importer, partial [Durusdinium trenchii]